ncbi:MAG: PIN domain-containing protein [Campylobacterales bacterium]|nr:PIN domain-containing protein [Campylobacterales bacterium]
MRGRIFIDTNIILYSYSETELEKSDIANRLIFETKNIISNQVTNETINILYKKYNLNSQQIEDVILELDDNFEICNFTIKTQVKALRIKEKYKYQYYDSLIIATALESGCSILYSEDMQHNQIIENKLTIINPFIKENNAN